MAKRQDDSTASWLPMEGENSSAYAAFCIYMNLGVGRKATQVERALADMPNGGMPYGTICEWMRTFEWDRRCMDYDVQKQRFAEIEERAAMKKSIAKIQQERIRRIEIDMALSDELKARAYEMLSFPLHELIEEEKPVLQKDGKTLIVRKIFSPAKWSHKDAASLLKAAMDLEKASLFDDSAKIQIDDAAEALASDGLAEFRREQADRIRSIPLAPPPPAVPVEDDDAQEEPEDTDAA